MTTPVHQEPEPKFDHWKDEWNYRANKAADEFSSMPEEELLQMIRKGSSDSFYTIWGVLGEQGTPEKALPVLWSYLQTHPGVQNDLNRYHCGAALFQLLTGKKDEGHNHPLHWPVVIDKDGEEVRQNALNELKELIQQKFPDSVWNSNPSIPGPQDAV